MKVKILGVEYDLRHCRLRGPNDGYCNAPTDPVRQILINHKLGPRADLRVLIHELLHAAEWTKDETWVDQVSRDISAALWKLGWRRTG